MHRNDCPAVRMRVRVHCCGSTAFLQMRHLARELVVKERSIAALRASNMLHKQQLQQLAQSAVQAGLQVTPQRLLHIADEANSPAGHDSGSSSRYAALLEADSASSPAPAAAATLTKHYTAAESPASGRKQQPSGRPGSAASRPAGGSSPSVTPLAGFMQGTGSPSKQLQDDSGATAAGAGPQHHHPAAIGQSQP